MHAWQQCGRTHTLSLLAQQIQRFSFPLSILKYLYLLNHIFIFNLFLIFELLASKLSNDINLGYSSTKFKFERISYI